MAFDRRNHNQPPAPLTPEQAAWKESMCQRNLAEYAAHKQRLADADTIAELVMKHDPSYAVEILTSALYRLSIQPSELADWSYGD